MWCWMRRGNQRNTDGYDVGVGIMGSLPLTTDGHYVDVDYYQQILTPAVNAEHGNTHLL